MRGFLSIIILLAAACLKSTALDALPPPSAPGKPTHLAPGKDLGTYTYSASYNLKFSQTTAFPVAVILEDFAHREIFRALVPDEKSYYLKCNLPPGTYQTLFKPQGKGSDLYHSNKDAGFTVGEDGLLTNIQSTTHEGPFRRKIETVSPANNEEIHGDTLHLKWKPIPHVDTYTVAIMPIYDSKHPSTVEVDARRSWLTHKPEFSITTKELFGGTPPYWGYLWTVCDGDESSDPPTDQRIAYGSSIFLCSTSKEPPENDPEQSYPEDEWVDLRQAVRFEEPHLYADEITGVDIAAVGPNSPFTKAGLHPGNRIVALKGEHGIDLVHLKRYLAQASPGSVLILEVEDASVPNTYRKEYRIKLN